MEMYFPFKVASITNSAGLIEQGSNSVLNLSLPQ